MRSRGLLPLCRRCLSTSSAPAGPLSGIRVLDLSRILAGPFCTMLLGDLGADVVKVENPKTGGDDTRSWGPPFTAAGNEAAYFLAVNRNKRSIALDMKHPEGLEIVRRLITVSDVLVENFIAGKMDEYGLGYEEASRLNPRLVYASLTGYGATGPLAGKPGYDVMASAAAGLMHVTGNEAGPVKVGVALTDVSTGLFMHGAIMAALIARNTTGRGQKVDTSLLEAQVAAMVNLGQNYHVAGFEGRRWGTAHESIVPYQAFKTEDGHVVAGALNDKQFGAFAAVLGKPELASDVRFKHNKDRVANREALLSIISEVMLKHPTAHWVKALEASNVPCGPVNNLRQVFTDPQVLHRQMVQTVEHPTAGKINLTGPAVKYSETPATIRMPPPVLGQHTREILGELLGYGDGKLAQLERDRVVLSKPM